MPATPSQVEKLRNHSGARRGLAVHLGDVSRTPSDESPKSASRNWVSVTVHSCAGPLELGELVNHRGQLGLVAGPGAAG